jgi:transposase
MEGTPTQSRALAGIDVHKKVLAVVVRRDENGETGYEQRRFGTNRSDIRHLVAWLQHNHVTEVVMESTAQYWRPVWYGTETHFRLHMSHPLQTRAPRGRKWDFRDARRLADRLSAGDLEESFIPGAEQRSWRWLARTRVDLQRKMTRVRNQVEGVLEEGCIKLEAVVTDLFGSTGWSILERMAAGETDTEALVELAQGRLRKKKAQLREALDGELPGHCRLLLRQHMEQVTLMRKQVVELTAALSHAMKEHAATLERLCKMPGIDQCAAQALLAEIGPRAGAFTTPGQLASWIGVCPGSQESAGVSYSTRSAKGNRYLRRLLCQIAWAAVHSTGTFFAQLFNRLKPKIEAKGAAWAVAHRIAKVIWLVLTREVDYIEKGPAPPNQRTLMRKLRKLTRDFALLGIDFNKAVSLASV